MASANAKPTRQLRIVNKDPFRFASVDMRSIHKFLLSVGFARAMAETSTVEWQPTELPRLLQAIYKAYSVLPDWEAPGTAIFDIAPGEKLRQMAGDYALEWQMQFLHRLHTNPGAALQYLKNLERIRAMHLETVRMRMQAAVRINEEVDRLWTDWIKKWSTIKLGASVGLATVGLAAGLAGVAGVTVITLGSAKLMLGAPAIAFSAVSVGVNLIMTNIPDFDRLGSAQCVAVAVAQEAGGKGLERASRQAAARLAQTERLIREAEAQINAYSSQMGQQFLKEFQQPLQMAGYTEEYAQRVGKGLMDPLLKTKIAEQKQVIEFYREELPLQQFKASFWKGATYALPIVFFAYDIWQALRTYCREMQAARS